jgi:hypothetical protein
MSDDTNDEADLDAKALAPRLAAGVPVKRRRTRLHNIRSLRTHLGSICRELAAEDLASMRQSERTQHQRARIYASQVLGGLIQATEMEQRLAELERLILSREV